MKKNMIVYFYCFVLLLLSIKPVVDSKLVLIDLISVAGLILSVVMIVAILFFKSKLRYKLLLGSIVVILCYNILSYAYLIWYVFKYDAPLFQPTIIISVFFAINISFYNYIKKNYV